MWWSNIYMMRWWQLKSTLCFVFLLLPMAICMNVAIQSLVVVVIESISCTCKKETFCIFMVIQCCKYIHICVYYYWNIQNRFGKFFRTFTYFLLQLIVICLMMTWVWLIPLMVIVWPPMGCWEKKENENAEPRRPAIERY